MRFIVWWKMGFFSSGYFYLPNKNQCLIYLWINEMLSLCFGVCFFWFKDLVFFFNIYFLFFVVVVDRKREAKMEEVEQASRTAVESCHRVLSLLSQPRDQVHHRNLTVETGEAVNRFKKVVSLLHGLDHSRVKKLKNLQNVPYPQTAFLDNPNCKRTNINHTRNVHFTQTTYPQNSVQELGSTLRNPLSLGNPSLELSSNGKSPLHLAQQAASTHYQFYQPQQQHHHQQQLQQQRLLMQQQQQQQQMKQQAEMMFRRNTSGISLNFDKATSSTPTMSSTRSFISSLSIDGSVANMDGSSFHLIGAPISSDQNSQHKRKCSARGDEGSLKCSSSSKCHCSKKR